MIMAKEWMSRCVIAVPLSFHLFERKVACWLGVCVCVCLCVYVCVCVCVVVVVVYFA